LHEIIDSLPPTGHGKSRTAVQLADCDFYHHMIFPGGEQQAGHWDLRPCVDDYLGHLDYSGKKVIEIGPASGFLTFALEARGATVTGIELSRDYVGDVVPLPGRDPAAERRDREALVARVINSFWYGHGRMGSHASVYYGDARELPDDLGTFDIGLLGAVLLHSRDPAGMLISCANRVTENIVIVDGWHDWMEGEINPALRFVPEPHGRNNHTWWQISPKYLEHLLAVLGFKVDAVHRFKATHLGAKTYQLYSLVAHRK
jgi:O-methyltransferase